MAKEKNRWLVYHREQILKNGENWTMKKEFEEFFTESLAKEHYKKPVIKFGSAEIEKKKSTILFTQL